MFDISFAPLKTKNGVLVIFGKSNVRSSDFQVDKGGFFEVGGGISYFSKSQKSSPCSLKCSVNVKVVLGNWDCSCNTFENFFRNWESIFFHLWKKASPALKNSSESKVFKNCDWPMVINMIRSQA